ncbi:hypothetical protein DL764_001192 [Monosporascus ibericus]|uniref:Dienelactone hydrolase domain-containing protein n=1 Tax=Monosporascus ibericus TaxID=155417 RepID=A0A4Q4TVI5_9PEZI|nr:hypothetical protein DL764_001192 [Monosporascus ibericus]
MDNCQPLSYACTRGTLHDGRQVGLTRTIGGIQTYFSKPPGESMEDAILLFTDAMGITFENNKLLADSFAANGYFVVMPDLFRGDAVPLDRPRNWSQTAWFRNHLPSDVGPVVRAVLCEMQGSGCRRIAGVEEEDILSIERPVSIVFAGGGGYVNRLQRQEIEMMLTEAKVPFQTTLFSDVPHGFAVRHIHDKKYNKFAKKQAFLQAVQWLDFYMKGEGSAKGFSAWT